MSESKRYPKARKRFGQNFLQDQQIIADIIAAIDPQQGQHLVEIGPGRAALTEPLLKNCEQLDVIELDRDLIPILQNNLGNSEHLHIHNVDALKYDFSQLSDQANNLYYSPSDTCSGYRFGASETMVSSEFSKYHR